MESINWGKFEFNEDETRKITELRKLVEDCKELQVGTEDVFLTKFLYYAKWDVPKAFQSIHSYYDFKAKHPTWVSSRSLEELKDVFIEIQPRFILTKPDKDGRLIFVNKCIDAFDKRPDYFQDLVEMDDLIFEAILTTAIGQQNGLTIIQDLTGITKNFLKVLTPTTSKMINKKSDVIPFRERYIHMIQRGFFMNAASTLLMPFMSKEVKERMFTHDGKNFDKIREMVGADNLPGEYGGPEAYKTDGNNLAYELVSKNWEYLKKIQTYKKVV